jgi:hypothetical protein
MAVNDKITTHPNTFYRTWQNYTGSDNGPMKTWDGVLVAGSDNSGAQAFTIIDTAVPQDSYMMGGFTIEWFENYSSTNGKTSITLGGYWNPESNGGFVGWEYTSSNPNIVPTIRIARNVSTGNTSFILTHFSSNYAIVLARDLWLGYSGGDATYGSGWSIRQQGDTTGYTNLDTVVARTAQPAGSGSGSGLNADLLDGIDSTGFVFNNSTTNGSININGGTANAPNDGTVYITATNNNDWGLIVNKYNASATEYGVDIRMGSASTYALRVQGNGADKMRINGEGQIFAPIYYDNNDSGYYVDPNGVSRLYRLQVIGDWAGSNPNNGAINIRGNYPSMTFRNAVSNNMWLRHMDGSGHIQHYFAGGGLDSDSWSIQHTMQTDGTFYSASSMRSPIFYDSNDTAFYVNPASTSRIRRTDLIASGSGWDDGLNLYSADQSNRWNLLVDNGAADSFRIAYNNAEALSINTSRNVTANVDIRSPVFYDSNDTGYYLDPASVSNLNNVLMLSAVSNNNNGLRNVMPGGGTYVTSASSVTGAIVITLPQTVFPMLRFTVKVYTYDGLSFDIDCGGHTSGGLWYNTFAYMTTQNRPALNVRFTYGSGLMYVYIGELGTVWSYPQVFITDVQVGYTNYEYNRWDDGWTIGFNSSTYNNISATQTVYPPSTAGNNSNPAYASIYYDSNDTSYYVDPNSQSRLNSFRTAGQVVIGGTFEATAHSNLTAARLMFSGGDGDAQGNYYIGTNAENYGGNYNKLDLRWHTGIRMGAQPSYGGIRFYDTEDLGTQVFAIGKDGSFAQANQSMRAPIFYDLDNTGFYLDPASNSELNRINTVRANNFLYLDNNYGHSIVGAYASTRFQGVFAMGDAYKLPADGTTSGNLYGIAWSYPSAGGAAANLNTHGALILENGSFLAALSGSIRARDDMRAPIFYDSNNTGYYVDPASTSNLNVLNVVTLNISGTIPASTAYLPRLSGRDFGSGTLVQTSINYAVTNGDPFVIEITGNSYGQIVPWDIQIQGYIYADTIINTAGISNGTNISGIRAINYNGNLCFWWPRQSYWNGFTVYVYTAYDTFQPNRVTSITDVAQPTTAKQVVFTVYQNYSNYNSSSYDATFNRLYSNTDVRAPIYYDSNNTGYYLDPTSTQSLRTVGDWRADSSGWTGEFAGKIQYHSNNWYFQYNTEFLFRNAGGSNVFYGDNSGSTWATSSSRAPIFYDTNNTAYYCDPTGYSQMSSAEFNNYARVSRLTFIGEGGDSGVGTQAYALHQESGAWSFPYPDLRIAFHTGIKLGANPGYEGMRFYTDYDMSSRVMQVNGPSNYIYMDRWINVLAGQGIYSSENSAHFYPNNLSYGSWRIDGQRNGWGGIEFNYATTSLMMNDDTYGFHRNGVGWKFYVQAGNGYFPGEVTAYWSDRRLKENIAILSFGEGTALINKLKPSRFNWRTDLEEIAPNLKGAVKPGKEEVGLIAQEVQEVLPDAVKENLSGRSAGKGSDIESYLTVNYDRIAPFLIQAIQELTAKVALLEAQINGKN